MVLHLAQHIVVELVFCVCVLLFVFLVVLREPSKKEKKGGYKKID